MTAAELVAEAKRLEDAFCCAPSKTEARGDLDDFYHEHGPRLVALVEQALEMRKATEAYLSCDSADTYKRWVEMDASRLAFDALAGGEEKK